jgi:hypothetical protein
MHARFWTLYEDQRDTMSDDIRPEWGIAECKNNRMVEVVDLYRRTIFSVECDRETGNAMYKEMKPLDRHGYGRAECFEWLRQHGVNI